MVISGKRRSQINRFNHSLAQSFVYSKIPETRKQSILTLPPAVPHLSLRCTVPIRANRAAVFHFDIFTAKLPVRNDPSFMRLKGGRHFRETKKQQRVATDTSTNSNRIQFNMRLPESALIMAVSQHPTKRKAQ